MKTNIYISNNLISSAKKMFSALDISTQKHYVIVPDRFSLTVEKQILKLLNQKCCFNVEVLTLSRLVNRYIKNENKKLLTKNESIMLIKKCVIENQSKLNCFKQSSKTENFCENIFETIMQLKSCNITPSQITEVKLSSSLNIKLSDIKCIYESYEKYLKEEYIDSFNKLNLFCENLYKHTELKQYNISFAFFDNFTPLILKVISNLMRNCKSVNFALQLADKNQNNGHVYCSDMFNQIMLEAKSNAIQPNCVYCKEENNLQNYLRENLYSYKDNTFIANQFAPLLCSFTTIQNEIEYICSSIQRQVVENGERYLNFSVACANSELYFPAIKSQFQKLNIPFYIDQSKTLNQTVLSNLIINCLNYFDNYKTKTIFFNILDNPILNLEHNEINNLKNFCLKYNITHSFQNQFKIGNNEHNYVQCEETRKKVFQFIDVFKNLKDCETVNDFVFIGKTFLENSHLNENYLNFIEKLQYIDKFQYDIEKQAHEKMLNIFSNINAILNNQQITLNEFIQILKSGIKSCNISTIPLSVDCVFVGDVNNSVFEKVDNLFICGANQQNFPAIKQDVGLITDAEIKKINNFMFVEPTIRVINQRTKLKCMQLVCSFNKNLTISYSILDGAGKANSACEIIKQISKLINIYNVETKSFVNLPILNEEMLNFKFNTNSSLNDVCFNYVNSNNAVTKLINEIQNNPLLKNENQFENKQKVYSFLLKSNTYFKNLISKLNKNEIECNKTGNICFNKNNTSTTQIETYFSCPFKHFVKYALKVNENENGENLNASIGSLLHGVAEYFVQFEIKNQFKIEENLINKLSIEFFNKSVKNNKLEYVIENEDNKLLVEDLINECKRMCAFIHNSFKHSKFKAISTEQGFGEKYQFKEISLKVGNETYKIGGKIDRIDYFNNNFIVIDYKSGNTKFSIDDLYYGEKVQLFVYQFAITDQTGQIPVGIFYLPIKNIFSDDKTQPYQLDGVIINDVNIVKDMDTNLNISNPISKTLPVKLVEDKKTNIIKIQSKNALNSKNIQKLSNYAIDLSKNAIKEITENYIQPKPIKTDSRFSSCSFCAFKTICKFNIETDGHREKQTVFFDKGGEEEC